MRPTLRSSFIAHRSSLLLLPTLALLVTVLLLLGTAPSPRAAAQPPPPTVTSITPDYSPIGGGTAVVIEGTGFSTVPGETRFVQRIEGIVDRFTDVICQSSTRCTGVSAAVAAGALSGPIRAEVNGVLGPPGAYFAWYGVPVLDSLDPTTGPAAGGNPVILAGSYFPSPNWPGPVTVHFGDAVIEPPNGCEMLLACTVTVPAGTGTVDVTFETPGGISNALQYTYTPSPEPTPTVTSITPNYGPDEGGTAVVIEGTGFSTGPGATRFITSFDLTDVFTMVTCESATRCTGVSVANTVESGAESDAIRAEVNGVAGPFGARFAWYNVPVLDSLDPAGGPAAGGNQVTLEGRSRPPFPFGDDFPGPVTVRFGATAIELPTGCQMVASCTVTAPPGSGTVAVTITTPGGTSNARNYTYEAGPTPTPTPTPTPSPVPPIVSGLTPSSGPYFGGTSVSITGSGFSTAAGASTVAFGAAETTDVTCSSATNCTAVSSAGTGTVSVRVSVGGRQSADTAADDFTYLSPDATAMTLTGRVPAGSSGTLRALVSPTSAATARPPTPAAGSGWSFQRDGSRSSAARSLAQAAPAGTICGQVPTAADGSFTMPVFAASQVPGCGTAGAPLAFTLNDQLVSPAAPVSFKSGGSTDLGTLTPGPSPTPTPTPTPTPSTTPTPSPSSSPTPTPAPMTVTAQVWQVLLPIVSEGQIGQILQPVVGGTVEALVGDTVCGQGVTDGDGRVQLSVAPDPPTRGCGRDGALVRFRVNGDAAISIVLFRSGGHAEVTLILPPSLLP